MAKRPKGSKPQRSKRQGPHSSSQQEEPDDSKMSWRFSTLDRTYPQDGGWAGVDADDLQAVVGRIASLDNSTATQVLAGSEVSHDIFTVYSQEAIDQGFTNDAKRRLVERERDDATVIARIRLGSRKRLYAVKTPRGVYELLWWDPLHKIYPTEPKNT